MQKTNKELRRKIRNEKEKFYDQFVSASLWGRLVMAWTKKILNPKAVEKAKITETDNARSYFFYEKTPEEKQSLESQVFQILKDQNIKCEFCINGRFEFEFQAYSLEDLELLKAYIWPLIKNAKLRLREQELTKIPLSSLHPLLRKELKSIKLTNAEKQAKQGLKKQVNFSDPAYKNSDYGA